MSPPVPSRRATVAATIAVTLALLAGAAPAAAAPAVDAQRLGGSDRIDTAARIAEETFARDTTSVALVASAADFPDALAAAALAGRHRAPVLLTGPDELSARTAAALDTLEVDRVIIMGGTNAVSAAVADELAERWLVDRVGGASRYATAAEAARHVADASTVLLASGERFPDALTAGPLAYHGGHPILLTGRDELPAAVATVLAELDVDRAIAVGGGAAISDRVLEEVQGFGIATERIAGADRTATAAAFADVLIDRFGFSADVALLARGDAFPDAVAAGPRAGLATAPILLARGPAALGDAAAAWLAGRCPEVTVVEAVGGTGALAASTLDRAVAAAQACAGPQRTITYTTGTRGIVHADVPAFRHRVAEALGDSRGWSLGGDIAFEEVDGDADFRVWLASPDAVAAAHPVCHRSWSCRVGDDVYLNDERWRASTPTFRDAGLTLTEYRWYVVNHEVGHWLGHGHYDCPGPGEPAPVMQQQSIRLDGCAANVWPLEFERDAVRARWLD